MRRFVLFAAITAALSACAAKEVPPLAAPSSTTSTTTTTTATAATAATSTTTSSTTTAVVATTTTTGKPLAPTPATVIDIEYVLDGRTTDEATADFEAIAEATLSDPRGWERARFRFIRSDEGAPYRIVLAEGDEVDRLCLPYDTYGQYSCQNGPVVALNADRWRASTPKWTGDLESYRRMLVNHEVGHLLGQKHPRPQCPGRGLPAPIMNQQSTELNGCLPNPWPLDSEIEVARRHDRKLAPGPGE